MARRRLTASDLSILGKMFGQPIRRFDGPWILQSLTDRAPHRHVSRLNGQKATDCAPAFAAADGAG